MARLYLPNNDFFHANHSVADNANEIDASRQILNRNGLCPLPLSLVNVLSHAVDERIIIGAFRARNVNRMRSGVGEHREICINQVVRDGSDDALGWELDVVNPDAVFAGRARGIFGIDPTEQMGARTNGEGGFLPCVVEARPNAHLGVVDVEMKLVVI